MRNNKLLLTFLLFLCTSSAKAYDPQEGKITAVIGPFIYKSNFATNEDGAKSPVLADFGILASGDVNKTGSIEIGLIHMHKLFFRDQDAYSIVEETQQIQVSMGYRRWISPYLSTGLSFYSAYPMDEPRIVHNTFPLGTEPQTSAQDLTEYGLEFSVQSELWQDSFISVVADARYSLNLTSKANEKADHYGILLGIRYLVQEK